MLTKSAPTFFPSPDNHPVEKTELKQSERPDPDAVMLKNGELAATPEQVFAHFQKLDIAHYTQTHEPLYTVEQARSIHYEVAGAHTKNLFLRNKKGRMFLLVAERDQPIELRLLRDKLQVPGGQFAFASTERLAHYLGVVPGSVSALAAINDHERAVQILMQQELLEHEWIYQHPCRNTHSTRLKVNDLLEVLESWKHAVTLMDLNDSA